MSGAGLGGKEPSGAAKAVALMGQAFEPVLERICALGLKLGRRSDGSAYAPWDAWGTGAGLEMQMGRAFAGCAQEAWNLAAAPPFGEPLSVELCAAFVRACSDCFVICGDFAGSRSLEMAKLPELDRLPADWPGMALDRVLTAAMRWEGGKADMEQLSYLSQAAPELLSGPKAMAFREKMKEHPALAYAALSLRQGHTELSMLYSALAKLRLQSPGAEADKKLESLALAFAGPSDYRTGEPWGCAGRFAFGEQIGELWGSKPLKGAGNLARALEGMGPEFCCGLACSKGLSPSSRSQAAKAAALALRAGFSGDAQARAGALSALGMAQGTFSKPGLDALDGLAPDLFDAWASAGARAALEREDLTLGKLRRHLERDGAWAAERFGDPGYGALFKAPTAEEIGACVKGFEGLLAAKRAKALLAASREGGPKAKRSGKKAGL